MVEKVSNEYTLPPETGLEENIIKRKFERFVINLETSSFFKPSLSLKITPKEFESFNEEFSEKYPTFYTKKIDGKINNELLYLNFATDVFNIDKVILECLENKDIKFLENLDGIIPFVNFGTIPVRKGLIALHQGDIEAYKNLKKNTNFMQKYQWFIVKAVYDEKKRDCDELIAHGWHCQNPKTMVGKPYGEYNFSLTGHKDIVEDSKKLFKIN